VTSTKKAVEKSDKRHKPTKARVSFDKEGICRRPRDHPPKAEPMTIIIIQTMAAAAIFRAFSQSLACTRARSRVRHQKQLTSNSIYIYERMAKFAKAETHAGIQAKPL
jgi:hypothetical protein